MLWELDPVEVVTRPVPAPRRSTLPAVEAGVFGDEAVDVEAFRAYLRENDLALIVSRNVTQRDRADRHQPFNLRVPGGVSSIATGGTVYDVSFLQIFQGDAVRGYGGIDDPSAGRRLLARTMHGAAYRRRRARPRARSRSHPTARSRRSSARTVRSRGSSPTRTAPVWCASATGSASKRARSACARAATASTSSARPATPSRPTSPRRCASCSRSGKSRRRRGRSAAVRPATALPSPWPAMRCTSFARRSGSSRARSASATWTARSPSPLPTRS